MSIRAIELACPNAILPVKVALFPAEMVYVIYIHSGNRKLVPFVCWEGIGELGGKHTGESFMSLRLMTDF